MAYGDPHFATFDDTMYTFNGRGEFVALDAQNPDTEEYFTLQLRMQSPGHLAPGMSG